MDALKTQVGGYHYKSKAIQPITYILANGLGFCEGNIIKYATRWRDKGGIEDLKKVIHYAQFLIEEAEKVDPIKEVEHMRGTGQLFSGKP